MEKEVKTVICKVCNELKKKIRSRVYKYDGVKYYAYRDEDGLQWNGRTCGKCNRVRALNNMHRLRKQREVYGDEI